MKIAEKCLYTIVHSETIDRMIKGLEDSIICINMSLTTARKGLDEAKKTGNAFYCVIAPAEDTTFLSAFGIVEEIRIDHKNRQSSCIISNMHYFSNRKIKKSSLILNTNDENLSEGYIRPYAVCKTETLLKEFDKYNDFIKAAGKIEADVKEVTVERYRRDPRVKLNVLERADGYCELCGKKSPFVKPDGFPYFEIHHLLPLAEGGSDCEENAVCLCPNCHRELHYGKDSKKKTKLLISKIKNRDKIR